MPLLETVRKDPQNKPHIGFIRLQLRCTHLRNSPFGMGTTRDHDDQLDGSNIVWDDSFLTNNYDEQLRLVESSQVEPSPGTSNKEAKAKSLANKQKIQMKKEKDNSAQSQEKKVTFSNRSRKFKYDETRDDDEPAAQLETNLTQNLMTEANNTNGNHGIGSGCVMPPPCDFSKLPPINTEDEARTSMLMAWYMAGYQTGFYEAMRKFKK